MMIFSRMGKVCSFEGDNCGVNDIRVGYPGDQYILPTGPHRRLGGNESIASASAAGESEHQDLPKIAKSRGWAWV